MQKCRNSSKKEQDIRSYGCWLKPIFCVRTSHIIVVVWASFLRCSAWFLSKNKLKFQWSSFLVASSQHSRDIRVDTRDMLARMLRGCRACRATLPFSLPHAYLIGRPAVCCGVVLPVCPCVVSFSKFHEPDTHNLLRTSR